MGANNKSPEYKSGAEYTPETGIAAASLPSGSSAAELPVPPEFDVETILAGHLSAESVKAYRSDMRHFLAHIGLCDPLAILPSLRAVDRAAAAGYRDHMLKAEGLSAATVNRRLTAINTLFNTLKNEGWLERNPFAGLRRPRVGTEGKTPAFSREQAERVLAQPDATTVIGRRDRVLLLLMFFCGLRRSEVVRVRREDFAVHQGHPILWVQSKGRSDKADTVKIPLRIWPEIERYAKERDDYLFTSEGGSAVGRGEPLSASRVYVLFKNYCRLAGLRADAFSPHSTRTTFITLCLEGGADVRSVMYAARHANPATTIRYDRQRLNLENHATNHLCLGTGEGEETP